MTGPARSRFPVPAGAPDLVAVVARMLAWLYETPQPDGAMMQHHGRALGAVVGSVGGAPLGRIRVNATPAGVEDSVVVVVDAHRRDLGAGVAACVDAAFARWEVAVVDTWNGATPGSRDYVTGSWRLAERAHPSLLAAVDAYRAGCPTHRSVFCDDDGCGWFRDGAALLVGP